MEVRSIYKFARISPLKARDVAREIQGLPVSEALDVLNFTPRKAAFLIGKTLKSAIANAEILGTEREEDVDVEAMVVKSATVDEGPSFRRFKPRARGSASPIKKRTSHITVIVTDEYEEIEEEPRRHLSKEGPKPKAAKKKKAAPKKAAEEAAPPRKKWWPKPPPKRKPPSKKMWKHPPPKRKHPPNPRPRPPRRTKRNPESIKNLPALLRKALQAGLKSKIQNPIWVRK